MEIPTSRASSDSLRAGTLAIVRVIPTDERAERCEAAAVNAPELQQTDPQSELFGSIRADVVKANSVRGGLVVFAAQGVKLCLSTGSSMVLARLLTPHDFGLQGMVTALTGILALFSDVGLSMATIQRQVVTHEQTSTLFWINLALGAVLTLLTAALAPALVAFYHEPRLFWITVALASTFLLGGLGTQHSALLVRNMKFVTRAKIEMLSLAASVGVGITMAALGFGYWALVGMTLSSSLILLVCLWLSVRWIPGRPGRASEVRAMFHFGGTLTLNRLINYASLNAEKILLGRFWGADALGLYGRAYSLVNLPMTQLNSSVFTVAFPALSRLQSDRERLISSFLKGYSVLLSVTVPATIGCILFAEEIVQTVLGAKWLAAPPLVRLLGPTILVFTLCSPLNWFLTASGRVTRALKLSLVAVPVVLVGIIIGLPYGPKGVALAYSGAWTLLVIPITAWAIHGTGIQAVAFWKAAKPAAVAGLLMGICGFALERGFHGLLPPLPRLALGSSLALAVYCWVLLAIMGQWDLFRDLVSQVWRRKAAKSNVTGLGTNSSLP